MKKFLQKQFGFLIICYEPTNEDISKIKKNISSFKSGIIIWNSKKVFNFSSNNCIEIELENNVGQARALNIGFKIAISMGLEILLTLDQDSKLLEKSSQILKIINYFSHFYKNPYAFTFKPSKEEEISKINPKKLTPFLNLTSIISGTVYLTSSWNKLNGFKDELFIEGIDTEFSIKAKRKNFNLYKFKYPIIFHDAGLAVKKKIFNFNYFIRKHSDERIYLQYRNNLPIFIDNFIFFPKWSLKSIFNLLIKKIIVIILGSENIPKTLFFVIKGILDGILELTPLRKNLEKQERYLQ